MLRETKRVQSEKRRKKEYEGRDVRSEEENQE